MKSVTILILLVLILLGSLIYMESQFEGISKEQGNAILEELKSIRQELNQIKQKGLAPQGKARSVRPTSAKVSTVGNPMLGDKNAPVTIVEFTDYQCPFCQGFYSRAYKELKKQYVDTGKLRFVLRDLPLPNHQFAKPAAIASHCAGEQNKFWEMHDALFEGGGKLNPDDILDYASTIGLQEDPFNTCLTSGKFKNDINQDVQDAKNAGIRGTPAFVIGKTTNDMVSGTLIAGTRPFTAFKQEIDKLISAR
jgi:protein-disulfide isomerase